MLERINDSHRLTRASFKLCLIELNMVHKYIFKLKIFEGPFGCNYELNSMFGIFWSYKPFPKSTSGKDLVH